MVTNGKGLNIMLMPNKFYSMPLQNVQISLSLPYGSRKSNQHITLYLKDKIKDYMMKVNCKEPVI